MVLASQVWTFNSDVMQGAEVKEAPFDSTFNFSSITCIRNNGYPVVNKAINNLYE